jgi:hypothetical protein
MPPSRSSTVIGRPAKLLKSNSSTFCDPAGISLDGTRTAAVTDNGRASEFPELSAIAGKVGSIPRNGAVCN